MSIKLFYDIFPEVAEIETRMFYIKEDRELLTKGYYQINERYCVNPECDCKDVHFFVTYQDKILSEFTYNWNSFFWDRLTYAKSWEISEYDKEIFKILKEDILTDKSYIKRLKKHYKMMKDRKDELLIENVIYLDDLDNSFFLSEKSNLTKKQEKERNRKKIAKKQKQRNRK